MSDQTPLPLTLKGKIVIQFGGTGLLGPSLISALGAAGATVVIASRNRSSLDEIVARERAAGADVHPEEADPQSEPSLLALRDRVLAQYGRVDGLVYNSAARPMRTLNDDLSAWKASMDANATGFIATVRTFGNAMAERKSGSIVNIASMYGMVGMNPFLYEGTSMTSAPDYFFHKGGMINVTKYLASYYGAHGVRVNVVSPGGIYNPSKPQAPAFLERYAKMTMLGRMADARELGGPVVFLLSDAAAYVTGANLVVDGGYTAK
ncbi:MAG: SDR family oxidoreductase [Opitutaceae bacterium]|nr:SDR family oxidoreductase [Opitutaceae bacterium]